MTRSKLKEVVEKGVVSSSAALIITPDAFGWWDF